MCWRRGINMLSFSPWGGGGAGKTDKKDVTQVGGRDEGCWKNQEKPKVALALWVGTRQSILDAHNKYSDANHYQTLCLRASPTKKIFSEPWLSYGRRQACVVCIISNCCVPDPRQ